MDWSAFPFVEYFPSERFPKWEEWKLYYLDVVDVLQMSEDLAMSSMLGLLRGWALQAVLDLPFRFWCSETGEVVMSLEQYFDIIDERLSLIKGKNCDHTDNSRSRGRNVTEEGAESEKSQAEGWIKRSLNENSDENSELSEVGSELKKTGCKSQDEAMRKFQNVIDLLQLSEEQAEQLGRSMLGEEQIGIKYRYDQRIGHEIIVIPSEWLETNVASTDFKKESFECFDEEACRGKENDCNRAEQCKNFDAGKGSEDRKLELRVEKQEEERKRRETLTHVDIESKEQRRLQEENREKFLSKLEKVVTPEGFEYYVDRSSANDKGDDCFFMSDLYFEGSEDDETELPPEFFGFTQETILKDVHLMVPEFLSLVGGGEVDMREIESNQRTFAECLAEDNLRANLIEKIGGVIEEDPCIAEKRGCVSSSVEEESFRNKNKIREKSNGSVYPASVSSGHWRCTDLQTNRIGDIFRQFEGSGSPGDLKGKWLKLWAVNNPQGDAAVKEFQAELETRSRAIVDFEKDRSVVQSPKNLNRRDRIQVLSRGYEACLYWDTEGVFESSGKSTSAADLEEVFDDCTSIKQDEQLEVISRASEGVASWGTTEVFTVPKPTKERAHWICNLDHCKSAGEFTKSTDNELQKRPQLLSMSRMRTFQRVFEHTAPVIRKEWEFGQASLVVLSEESITALNEFETVDLKEKVQLLGRARDTIVKWDATSGFLQLDAVFESTVMLTDNFHSHIELVETISQVHLGGGGSSDVTDGQRLVKSCDNLSVFRTSVENLLSWLEFLLVLMFGIMKSFWKFERSNDSQILAEKQNHRNQQDQILGCLLVETNKLRQEPGFKKLNQGFKNYVSRSEKCSLVAESSVDTSNFPSSSESMQGCEYVLKQSSSLECSNQRLRLRLRIEAGHGVVLAIKKAPLLKMSSGKETCLTFGKRRNVSSGGRYTKRYLRKFEKLNETSRKQVELGKGNELSSTDESIGNTDVEEAQPDLPTDALCVITTEELDFRSTLDSEAGNSLSQLETINGMTSDRVEDRYVDPQLNAEVEGTEEIQRINEGEIRQNNVWMIERDSDERWFQMGAAISYVSQGQGRRKECYPFSLGYSNDLGRRSEEVDSMPIAGYPQVDSTSDVVYSRRREPQSVVDLHSDMMGLTGDVHSRREEFGQRGFCFNGCRDSLSRGTMWLQASRKARWSKLNLKRRWCWRRRPPDVRCWSREEMGGHPFKHRRKKDFEEVQSVS